jgi:putative integral membrane protein (TIGR02587 family)
MKARHTSSPLREFAEGLGRAFAGSVLFALPLWMTMEMWWLGFYMSPFRLVVLMLSFFPLLVGLSHYIGFDETGHLGHAALHAAIACGVAIISSTIVLTVIAVVNVEMGWHELAGKAAVQTGPAALGALFAQAHFGSTPEEERRRRDTGYAGHLFFMLIGALYVALTVAPTEEMPMIGFMMHDAHAFAAMALSLLLLHVFLQGAGFEGHAAAEAHGTVSIFLRLTVVGYVIALAASAFLLWIFGRFDNGSLASGLHTTVALGLPATVGAGAARLTLDAA